MSLFHWKCLASGAAPTRRNAEAICKKVSELLIKLRHPDCVVVRYHAVPSGMLRKMSSSYRT